MNEKSEKAMKSICRSIANIDKQVEILRLEYPEAQMYVEDGVNYNVMKGSSHDDTTQGNSIQDNVLGSFRVKHSECGAW